MEIIRKSVEQEQRLASQQNRYWTLAEKHIDMLEKEQLAMIDCIAKQNREIRRLTALLDGKHGNRRNDAPDTVRGQDSSEVGAGLQAGD